MENLLDFFTNNFLSCVWFAVILVAMIPTLECKIAIPLAMNSSIWGEIALSPFASFCLATLGSIIPCYLIIFLTRYLKNMTSGFFINKHLSKYLAKSNKIEGSKSQFSKYIALMCFTAVPLPLTGVWSASLIAGFTKLNINLSFLSISAGALVSSAIITILCTIFENSVGYILLVSLALIIIFIIFNIIYIIFKSFISQKKTVIKKQ